MNKQDKKSSGILFAYAGMATQLIAGLLITVYFGKWVDQQFHFLKPVFSWILPSLLMIGSIIKIIYATSKKK